MIEADETPGGIPAPEPEEPRGLPPGKAFLILLAVLVAGAAVVLILAAGGDGEPGEPAAGGTFQLSDEQALERFHELWALSEQARMERDPSLISLLFTTNSESGQGALDSIRNYLENDLFDRSVVVLMDSEVVTNSAEEVKLDVASRVTPCVVTADGEMALEHQPRVLQRQTLWTIRPEESQWKVFEVRTYEEEVIRSDPNACP